MYEMDAHHCLDSRFADQDQRLIYEADRNLDQNGSRDSAEGCKLHNVALSGGAPWGFTLRGGLEHGEPLIITKVEEGSKAAAVRLQAGDELVTINEVPLNGYRQEAICLVKGSHKTLTLEVKRRSEPMSRPHSWHSTKFNENQSDTAKAQHTPSPVWQTRYDASSFSSDITTGWQQTNLRRVSDQFSSLGSMDSLEHNPHPYPSGRLSPSKSNANSIEHLGGGKRDSAYSSFSTSSGTPDYTLSKSNTASTENMLYKVSQWDSGSRPSNSRISQNLSDVVKQDDRLGFLQLPSGSSGRESPRAEEQTGHRHPGSGRASIGPIWHIPDMKKTITPSPPPPPPPTRSDSFAATKVHEKGLVPSYTEGPGNHVQSKLQGKGLEKATDISESTQRNYQCSEPGLDTCQIYNPAPKSETLNPYIAIESYNHSGQNLNLDDTCSLSSTDVRAGLSSYTPLPYHHRQYSDESTFHAPSRTPSVLKNVMSQNIGSCYSSMQELPTNSQAQHHTHNQIKRPTASVSSTAIDQNVDTHSSSRYYCVTSRQHPLGMPQASLVQVEDWKANSATEMTHSGVETSQGQPKDKYNTNQVPQHLTNNKDSNEYYRQVDGQHGAYTSASGPCQLLDDAATNILEIRENHKSNVAINLDAHFVSYPPIKQSEPGKIAGPLGSKESSQEHLLSESETKSSPPKNPMLHSPSQECGRVSDSQVEMGSGSESVESVDHQVARQTRHNDRFATTLRNEIQMRRAQLQKSRSTAALGGSLEAEEPSVWRSAENSSSSDGSFTSTYKDHLKEAQARVLKATSFKRRDLEPVLLEHPGAEVQSVTRRDTSPLPSVSEGPLSKPALGGNQVTRICGRKRIPTEKKVRSFSEPEKMNEVGVNEEMPLIDSSVSLVGRLKFFEAIAKPAYSKPTPKQTSDDPSLAKSGGRPQSTEIEATRRDRSAKAENTESSKHGSDSLQRLGTFAEYEATWNTQRKPAEPRPSGRYHSADNILDPGVEERSKPSCFHGRSLSSPSEDFYGQNIPVQERRSAEYTSIGKKLSDHKSSPRISQGGSSDLVSKQNQEPSPSYLIGGDLEKNLSANPAGPSLYFPDFILTEPSSFTKNKSPVSQRPPLPHLDKYKCPEETTPPICSTEDGAVTSHSPVRDVSLAPVLAPGFWKELKYSKVPKTEEEPGPEATPLLLPSPPGPLAHQAAGLAQPTGPQPTMEGHRSPSPHFAPQRLTDKPPVSVSLQDEAPGRMDTVTDDNTTVKKVPIKIVRSESNAEKESRQYLHPSTEAPTSPLGTTASSLPSLGSPEQSSLFCTYTRHREQGPEHQTPAMGPQKQQELHGSVAGPQEVRDQQNGPCNGVALASLGAPSPSGEDEKREVLTRDIIDKDKSLADILDQSKMKTTMDLMEGIFPQGEQLMEEAQQRRRAAPKQASSRSSDERQEEASAAEAAAVALLTSSAYYSTSAPKAELLIKMKDMQEQSVEVDSEEELGEDSDSDLANKKQELIASLSKKLQVLREARESLRQDVQDNDALGEDVEATVQAVCKPNELEKFRMFVGDLDKVVSLLLSLSGRLARVENALNSLEEDTTLEERRTLTEKRKLLIRQHEDAKELKENLDRRESTVYGILAACLPDESLADYEHFVKMKSALIIEQRKLEDKIKLGEEQLKCLVDSLPLDQRPCV
ncbi:protein Shroom2 isoform X2 [Electrophorus electricus]|uniref:protein Shroom2 isoform X2 n=1 Tax=Electrophorus electricus TaxID=8005 RepID=UPI0015CFC347|nr:protein Shroom2 isoform X2 [Electrophorus electricus]